MSEYCIENIGFATEHFELHWLLWYSTAQSKDFSKRRLLLCFQRGRMLLFCGELQDLDCFSQLDALYMQQYCTLYASFPHIQHLNRAHSRTMDDIELDEDELAQVEAMRQEMLKRKREAANGNLKAAAAGKQEEVVLAAASPSPAKSEWASITASVCLHKAHSLSL
jgi:hypothetical protein